MLIARFSLRWSYLAVLLIPVAGYFAALWYYTPPAFHTQFQLKCENQLCHFELNDEVVRAIESNLQNQLDQAERLDAFSKPLAGFMRYVPEATNKSTITYLVSEPQQNASQNAFVICELPSFGTGTFSYNSGMVKSINSTLLSCFRGLHSESTKLGLVVAPNATLSVTQPTIDFFIEFSPDSMSKALLALEVLAVFLALLPLVREGVRLLIRGWSYFIK